MGSEHYCLKWNNHQSNLLGVFSQLLQDESLVDVTLACAEGPTIRAHKVVLSACSSYFQSLFVDHPNRYPIVILTDVCFAELRTLVEFMYKGEVNVEYCQLSALLKTAEILKVKGLAEMTNLNSTTTTSVKRDRDERGTDGVHAVQKQAGAGAGETPFGAETANKRLTSEDAESGSPGRNSSPGPPPSKKPSRGPECEDASDCERDGPDAGERNDARGGCTGPADLSASGMASCQMPPSCSSPHVNDPFPGTSCLPPVQQVPLSLKKEVDWENKSTAGESSSDYRQPPDSDFSEPDLDDKHESLNDFPTDRRPSDGHQKTPFQLPFPPFGPFAEVGESSFRQSALLGFLQQQGFLPSPVDEVRPLGGGPSPYRCVICLAAFPSAWLLEQHNSLQHSTNSRNSETGSPGEDKPFKCEQCGQSYRYRSAYLKHQEQNHRARLPADKLFTCDVCGMQFRYLKSFKKHRLNHALEKLHTKSPNGEMFLRTWNNGAFEKYSRNAAESSTDLGLGAKLSFLSHESLKLNGEAKESGRVTAPPAACMDGGSDQVSSSNETLGDAFSPESMDRAASVPVSKTDQQNLFRFSKDGYRFDKKLEAEVRKKSAKSERVSDSEQDETIDSLACAFSTAGSNEAFRFQPEASLANLLRMDPPEQHRENRFSCPFCGKCVRSKENLKLHIRKHTGERPFVCLFCGRAFGGKSDLTRHLRIHTGERPYHCETCGKCFARADYLSKHLTTHNHSHNTRPSFSQFGHR